MKNKWTSVIATVFFGTALFLTSCGGNNADMPPESTHGDTQETGVEGTGDLPGTAEATDTTIYNNRDVPVSTGTTSGTTTGSTTGY